MRWIVKSSSSTWKVWMPPRSQRLLESHPQMSRRKSTGSRRSSADSSRKEGIMTTERPNEDLRTVWRTETSDTARLSRAEIQRIVDEMERKMRRSRVDFIAAVVLVSVTIIAIAVLFPGPLLTLGAVVTIAGCGILSYEVSLQWRVAPLGATGGWASFAYHGAGCQQRLCSHRS